VSDARVFALIAHQRPAARGEFGHGQPRILVQARRLLAGVRAQRAEGVLLSMADTDIVAGADVPCVLRQHPDVCLGLLALLFGDPRRICGGGSELRLVERIAVARDVLGVRDGLGRECA
jgi:hypothetical protein